MGVEMTDADHMRHKVDEYAGKAKQSIGEHTDNPGLAEEGREDQAESKVKQVGDHLSDAADDVKDAFGK